MGLKQRRLWLTWLIVLGSGVAMLQTPVLGVLDWFERAARVLRQIDLRHACALLTVARSSFGDNGGGGDGAPQR